MNQILRAYSAVVDDVNTSDRSIVAKISVGSVDRYNSLIEPKGIDLRAYTKNPVVLFEHGKCPTRGSLPIGRNVWVRLDKSGQGRLIAKTRFASDPFSETLYGFYRDGTMTGWSVRLLPNEIGTPPTREEIRSRSDLASCDVVYRNTELLEYSAAVVPGNGETLTDPELRSLSTLVVRGFWTPSEEVKPLVDPIVERMSECGGMADGGALVADDDEDESDDEDDDEKPKKKKKKKRSADDADDSVEMSADDEVERSIDPFTGCEEITEAELEEMVQAARQLAAETEDAEVVERQAPEVEAVEPEPEPSPAAEPEPVVETPDPLAGLPPLVGRSFAEILVGHLNTIHAHTEQQRKMIREFIGWAHGEG